MTTWPAVLFVHNEYRQRGGEDDCVRDEADLLADKGHRVSRLIVSNADLRAGLSTALRTVWSRHGRQLVREAIGRDSPNVVHFHNTFPLLSPSVYSAARAAGKVVVQTVHNYRLACVSGSLFREGRICTDCVGRSPVAGVLHACYRDSYGASAATAAMLSTHRALRTYSRHVDLFVAVSDYVRDVLIQAGLPSDRVVVSDNFVPAGRRPGDGAGGYVMFAGRLTVEKGIDALLRAWGAMTDRPPLRVAGDGPLAPLVRAAATSHSDLTYVGWLDRPAMLDQLANASAAIFPSAFPEPASRAILDALSVGTPVIASSVGGTPNILGNSSAGVCVPPGDAAALERALAAVGDLSNWTPRRAAAIARYHSAFSPEAAYGRICSNYADAKSSYNRSLPSPTNREGGPV